MPFNIVRQDITKMQVDAVVNAANNQLLMGGGVCGAIFRAAGIRELDDACRKVSPIKTGEAAITPGFALKAKYIIHAAGPVYRSEKSDDCERLLRSAYTASLKLALKNGCESIAFPLISGGTYGYPKKEALDVAISAIKDFLAFNDMDIYLAIFDKASFVISKELFGEVEAYIDEKYVSEHEVLRNLTYYEQKKEAEESLYPCTLEFLPKARQGTLEELVGNLDEPFNAMLFRLIDAKGKTDTEIYKRANIDRKLFSKIRTGKGYIPGKRTILALAIALELTLEETDDLLKRAGYALSHSRKFDVIVEYFIVTGEYDIFAINEVLFQYDQPLLGSC